MLTLLNVDYMQGNFCLGFVYANVAANIQRGLYWSHLSQTKNVRELSSLIFFLKLWYLIK